jgi:phage shock protein PspC (stress-responsive transcriptional regulator)
MNETTETTTPDPTPKRLERVKDGRMFTGVAAGIGRYLGVDANLVRIGFVALTVLGGCGILVYLAAAVLLPGEDGQPPIIKSLRLPWRSGAGRAAIGATLLVIAAAAVLASTDAVHWDTAAAIAILGFGVILIVAAFAGGARWLIAPALILVLPLAIVAAADVNIDGGVGQRHYDPADMSELQSDYRLGMGELDIDMRSVELPAGQTDMHVEVGVGHAVIRVPEDACVTSDVEIGVGQANVFHRGSGGIDVAYAQSATPSYAAGRPHLHLDGDVGIGAFEVVRGNDPLYFRGSRNAHPLPSCPA